MFYVDVEVHLLSTDVTQANKNDPSTELHQLLLTCNLFAVWRMRCIL